MFTIFNLSQKCRPLCGNLFYNMLLIDINFYHFKPITTISAFPSLIFDGSINGFRVISVKVHLRDCSCCHTQCIPCFYFIIAGNIRDLVNSLGSLVQHSTFDVAKSIKYLEEMEGLSYTSYIT